MKRDSITTAQLEEHVYNMKIVGYSIIPNYLDEDECVELKGLLSTEMENYKPVDESERSFLDRYHMHDLLTKDIRFAKTLEDEKLQNLIAPLLGDCWIMYAYTSSSLPPNGQNYGSRIHVDSPRFIPDYTTNVGVIWALDEFNLENGATHILPGSHNSPIMPTQEFFDKHSIRLTCKSGDLIVFNARLWHAAGHNKTKHFRHALTLNACRPFMKQRMDWVRFIPQNISDNLNNQARRIIGFDTRIPTNLQEFFLPENERFYKANQE
jgi:ectoine hydroxylase-related dioxygenase (phytanoyl-CoA dioxygenase family)